MFFVDCIVVVPLLVAWGSRCEVLYVRYFIVSIAFSLILLSFVLASLYRRPGYAGKIVTLAVLVGYMAANGWHLMTLFQYGRGDDRAAVRYMIQNMRGPVATVGGDLDFRVGTVVQFYTRTGIDPGRVCYCPQTSWPPEGVEWLVCERESFEGLDVPANLTTEGHRYDLVRTFPTAPLSGLHWFVYHLHGG
jgi:hypothetical protein